MKKLIINGCEITDDSPAYVIAEIGNNHQGSLDVCKDMFKRAKECGVNAVKLQKRDNHALFTKEAYNAPYLSENAFGKSYGEHRDFLEFGEKEYIELKSYAEELGLDFFATAFDQNSADFLEQLDMPMYKVASGDLANIPLLRHIARKGKPVILSTGGGTLEDVRRAVEAILPINDQLAILQCTAAYPCRAEDMNLRVISTYREAFPDLTVGLSDHQNGISMALVAFTLGARIFEKHFTLDRTWKGTDHAFSLEPQGLRRLVRDLTRARLALGDGVKRSLEFEVAPIIKMGKKIVAARFLPAGTVLTEADLGFKSPADGLKPYELDKVLGMTLTRDLPEDGDLSYEILK
ncbi:N-acetylneuraminate synthase family protein [Pseudodesulfovibrio sp.]|uniref:N-acetylneuraminate synthase family protein n=1 Tax=Pseudodesulfovibrio sp. TaxID=2035812 RepID=UPI0026157CBA|nr:N-acetylneuraminate synthase family protein [Pseudodesulfovibrio sp.]MDD3313318.1 N-acetylneuraminate synthase family protein [Pseudodesulfovibrio sp.]